MLSRNALRLWLFFSTSNVLKARTLLSMAVRCSHVFFAPLFNHMLVDGSIFPQTIHLCLCFLGIVVSKQLLNSLYFIHALDTIYNSQKVHFCLM